MIVLSETEDRDHVILVWNQTGGAGEYLVNRNGVTRPHVTRCVSGSVEFRFSDGRLSVTLGPSEEIILPTGMRYDVAVITSPAEVHCFYPKEDPEAIDGIAAVRSSIPFRPVFPTTRDESKVLPSTSA